MSSTITPNMSLVVPTAGSEAGPQYALDINSSLNIVDSHSHVPGSGVQITPAAINVNSTLTLNNNNLTNVAGLSMVAQSATPGVGTIYEHGVDLYYVDGSGNNIRLTQSGGIAGTPGSISGLVSPASATYVGASSSFVWQSGAGIAANLDAGSLYLRDISPNSTYAVNVNPPAGLSNNYSLQLPALPSVQSIMTLDASGNMAAPYTVDGTTIAITSNVIGVGALGITAAQIANGTITAAKMAMGVLPQLRSQTLTGSGSWTVPSTVSNVIVFGIGAGGGGGSGAGNPSVFIGGGAGGSGAVGLAMPLAVTPSGSVSYSVAGSAPGGGSTPPGAGGNNGATGGNSVFGSLTFKGAPGGGGAPQGGGGGGAATSYVGQATGGNGSPGASQGFILNPGQDTVLNSGGASGYILGDGGPGGGGGASILGSGGQGGHGGQGPGSDATGFGAGGGGGGGTGATGSGAGGAGSPGTIIVYWVA